MKTELESGSDIETPPLVEYGGKGKTVAGIDYHVWTDAVTGSSFTTFTAEYATIESAAIAKRRQFREAKS